MAGTSWKRKRERHRSEPGAEDPVPSETPSSGGSRSLSDFGITESDTVSAGAAEYSAWAERLKQKRVNSQRTFTNPSAPRTDATLNWQSENVFKESERVAYNDLKAPYDPVAVSAAFAVLGLEQDATLDDIDARYRNLAKQHHPDRFADDDEAVQLEHAAKFRSFSTARDLLRHSLQAS